MIITRQSILLALGADRYETREGVLVRATPVSQIPQLLRDVGWKNVPKYDAYDLRKLGLRIVDAKYVGGGRFCPVVVLD